MVAELLKTVLDGKALARAEARALMGALMEARLTPGQIGALLAALRVRGETLDELVGFAEAIRARATQVAVARKPLLDTCGTGGDGSGTFNISTTVAFIAAGAGAAVAKHGNRAVSSRCGSADVLEALGVKTEVSPQLMTRCVDFAGVGFLFAPALHPALKHVGPVRRELGVRTVFNLLGPLVNPAGARRQLLGVYSPELVVLMAEALRALGSERAWVVSSQDGLDEIALSAPTVVAELKGKTIRRFVFDPRRFGFKRVPKARLQGGDAAANAEIVSGVLGGLEGPARDVCVINAAAALLIAGIAQDFAEGLERAEAAIDGGAAKQALERLQSLTNGG